MNNPGDYVVFTGAINSATDRTSGVKTKLTTDLSSLTALTVIFDFAYGSGGNTCSAILQAVHSMTGKAYDIARADFAKTSKVTRLNLEGLLSVGATAYADLAAEGVNDGLLLSQLQAVILTDATGGDYANTTLTVMVGAR